MPDGIDYAFGRPPVAALHAAGVRFVCRYLSHSPSKNLTSAEAHALSDAGVWIVVVWETTAKRALDGRTAGIADAMDAQHQAQASGMPTGRPIYFAVDFDAQPGQLAAVMAYLDGAASVLGVGRTGVYGGHRVVGAALSGRHCAWAWQTYAWSGGRWDDRAQLQQYSNNHTLGGVGCDYDRATTSDFGQWRIGVTPLIEEDDMAQVSSLGAGGTLSVPAGGHADVKWTKEFSDKHKLHGDNGVSVVIATDTYWCLADAQFELRGLTPGAALDVAWTRVKDTGEFIDDAWRKTVTANAAGVIRDELGGQFSVNKDNRLRLRIYNPASTALSLTVVAADANKIPVTMAKASLFKY